jgi:hypothetical protein
VDEEQRIYRGEATTMIALADINTNVIAIRA